LARITEICDLVTSQIKSYQLKSNPNQITFPNQIFRTEITCDSITLYIRSCFRFAHHWWTCVCLTERQKVWSLQHRTS